MSLAAATRSEVTKTFTTAGWWILDKNPPQYSEPRKAAVARVSAFGLLKQRKIWPLLAARILSDPFWFQALGSVMGMDWHSSGITTSVMGALKRGLNPRAHELGVYICGGRGKQSRNTPGELRSIAERINLDGEALVRTSRLTARVDNNAVADGFQIYLHSFVLTRDGDWAVVQQGMNGASRLARRYHWHSAAVRDFTSEPHTGCGKFAARFGVDAVKFVNSPVGRHLHLRGVNARVLRSGEKATE